MEKFNEEIHYFLIARKFGEIIYRMETIDVDDIKECIKTMKEEVESYNKLKIPVEEKKIKDVSTATEIDKAQGEI